MENAGKVLGISTQANDFITSLNVVNDAWHIFLIILDIILVSIIFYWIFLLFRETRGIRIIYGIILLVILTALGQYLNLTAFNFIMRYLSTMIIVAIPVVLQPELRAALERLGRTNIVADVSKLKKREIETLLEQVIEAVHILSKNKIGALIVISRLTGLREFIDNGTLINATVTTELLLTIFTPNTALHDGAVIITGNKLTAAGCTLPLTEDKMAFSLGTRHRAALGMATQTDALVIIVSEETSRVSLAIDGKLIQNIHFKDLYDKLFTELNQVRISTRE